MNEAKRRPRILVVDDEERNRRLLVAMLEAENYTAIEAADGTQALELARQSPPDILLLDVMMPGIDGYEVARALKADAATKAIPVVMVTALDDRDSRLRGLEAGAEDFVTKPVDRNELRVRVRNLLRLKEFSDFLANHNRILDSQVRERTAELRHLSRRLVETEENERRRLARELHDRIAQNLTALSLNLRRVFDEVPEDSRREMKPRLDDCGELLSHTAKLVRDVMADLRPPGIDELGLVAALNEYASKVAGRVGFSVTVNGAEVSPRLPPATEITLFRIVQEALTNIAKHAGATAATLMLESKPDKAVLTIADNGCGFDAALQPVKLTSSLGMINMRERAESIGARLCVESSPGRGTRVIVEAPRPAP